MSKSAITPITWDEFRDTGLLWWVNRTLHLFGYAITVEMNEDHTITAVYPARTVFRGFARATDERGFKQLTAHLAKNAPDLLADLDEEDE